MKKDSRPNILIFNPDQWRSDVVGCNGNPAVQTPVIDALVQCDAVSFSNAYCQNTVCTPSRCSFMTGWYPHVRGHRTMFHMLHHENGENNLLKRLKDEGYFVWWGGKNDLTPGQEDTSAHCDVRYFASDEDRARWGVTAREGNHGGDGAWRGKPEGDNFFSFFKGRLDKGDEPFYADGDWDMVMGALDLIENWKGEQPLCIYLPLTYPHPPYCVEDPWYDLTDRSKLPPRPNIGADLPGKPSLLKAISDSQGLQGWTEERWDELRSCYYGMCSRLDHQLGLILEALKKKELYDDTALFLFADHGDYTGDYGIVEKTQNTFEDSLSKVPFIVKPPKGVPVKARVSKALVELVDFSATVYELTNIDPGYDAFGRSLLPVLAGSAEEHRDAAFCEGGRLKGEEQAMELPSLQERGETGFYYPRIRWQVSDEGPWHTKAAMCRMKRFKYIKRYYEQDELYDLENDPQECYNLIDNSNYTEVLIELKERMLSWYMETCDVVPREMDMR